MIVILLNFLRMGFISESCILALIMHVSMGHSNILLVIEVYANLIAIQCIVYEKDLIFASPD